MQKSFFFLSPVEVVKVTSSNLEEVAEWCGGKVAETESRRVPGRMDKYVWVPTPKGTSISWAFPGMFITKRLVRTVKDEIRVTFAVFRKDYFDKNYFDSPNQAVDETWEKHAKQEKARQKAAPKPTAPKNKLKGTSMEDYAPDNGEQAKGHPPVTPIEEVQLPEEVAPAEAQETEENQVTGVEVGPVEGTETDHDMGPTQASESEDATPGVETGHAFPRPDVDYRSAETGQYVSEEFASDNPDTTVAEVDEVAVNPKPLSVTEQREQHVAQKEAEFRGDTPQTS